MVVRPQVVGGLDGQGLLLLRRERDPQGLRDVARDLVLDLEDVRELAVVALRPDGGGPRLDELRGDAQTVAGAAQAARQHEGAFSCWPTCGPVTDWSRKATTAARGKTRSSLIFDSSVMMSSVMPSRKYSSSLAPLRFSK